MKKLFAILLFLPLFFSSCIEEKELYYNPVEGEWDLIYENGDVETIYFTGDFRTGGIVTDRYGRIIDSWNDGYYEINRDEIYYLDYQRGTYSRYRIVDRGRILQITDPFTGHWKEYYWAR